MWSDDTMADSRGAWVWLDLWSIPQRCEPATQMLGIKSIPAYVEAACCMLCLVPPVMHQETRELCDVHSYSKRGWYVAQALRTVACTNAHEAFC